MCSSRASPHTSHPCNQTHTHASCSPEACPQLEGGHCSTYPMLFVSQTLPRPYRHAGTTHPRNPSLSATTFQYCPGCLSQTPPLQWQTAAEGGVRVRGGEVGPEARRGQQGWRPALRCAVWGGQRTRCLSLVRQAPPHALLFLFRVFIIYQNPSKQIRSLHFPCSPATTLSSPYVGRASAAGSM